MPHLYEVVTNDGRSHHLSTPHHHDDHDDHTFRNHLLDVLKNTVSNVASQVIVRIIYKGRH